MKRSKPAASKRYEIRECEEYGVLVYKVWDTQTDSYVYGTCEYEWAFVECNRLNG